MGRSALQRGVDQFDGGIRIGHRDAVQLLSTQLGVGLFAVQLQHRVDGIGIGIGDHQTLDYRAPYLFTGIRPVHLDQRGPGLLATADADAANRLDLQLGIGLAARRIDQRLMLASDAVGVE